jgi:septum formation protein
VLASASPRRREILTALGVEFEVVAPDVDELSDGDPAEVVIENARRKAAAGAALAGAPDLPVLGVDTDVARDGRLLGKAADEAAARQRLEALSGRTHEVLSGVCVRDGGEERTGVARTEVRFMPLEPAVIDLYLRSGEWRDRAGAYAIQGLGSILIAGLQGDFSNVVGLPLTLLLQLAPNLLD